MHRGPKCAMLAVSYLLWRRGGREASANKRDDRRRRSIGDGGRKREEGKGRRNTDGKEARLKGDAKPAHVEKCAALMESVPHLRPQYTENTLLGSQAEELTAEEWARLPSALDVAGQDGGPCPYYNYF